MTHQPTFTIDTHFEGGNVLIDSVEDHHIHFQPDLRDTDGHWFYWYFAVKNASGKTLHFHPSVRNMLTNHAPAMSLDQGRTWQWLNPSIVQEDESFIITIPENCDDYRLSMGMPYVGTHLKAFMIKHAANIREQELCTAANGDRIPYWQIGPDADCADYRIFLTARHHCCEMMGSYVLEGIVEAALHHDELGQWYNEHVNLTAIPFVDYDGVLAGDQGKNRKPRDHNRDYDDHPIHPTTRPIQDLFANLARHGMDLVLDLHCPWIKNDDNESIYMAGKSGEDNIIDMDQFSRCIVNAITGPLPFDPSDNIPFGVSWNTEKNYKQGCSFGLWAAGLEHVRFGTTIEIPYAIARDQIIDAQNARHFGRDLAAAIRAFMTR
jgi:hypothetical protein